jgi:hypothetical protein
MNIGQCDLDPLFGRNIYTSNSCHSQAPFSLMTVVTGTRFTGAYFAAFIGSFSMKAANYRPKLVTVNLNANALPQ